MRKCLCNNIKRIFINLLIFSFVFFGYADELKSLEDTEKKELQNVSKPKEDEVFNTLLSLDLRNIDVVDALKFLSTKTGLNIVPTKNVSGKVSLTVDNVPFKDIFDFILRSNGLAYEKIGEIYNVMTETEYKTIYGKNFFDTRQVKIFRLNYAVPDQAFTLLEAVKSDIGKVLVDKESGNVLLMDTKEKIEEIEKILEEFEKKNIVKVFSIKYAKAKEVEDILKSRLEAKNVGFVKADERNNQVIVQALAGRMEEVEQLIKEIDKQTKEVLIDVKIVKVKLSDTLDTGIEWEGIFKFIKGLGEASYIGSYPFSYITNTTNPEFQTRVDTYNGNIGNYPFSGTTSSLNSSQKIIGVNNLHIGAFEQNFDFDALINFLNTIGQTKVLANPKIVVVNNQEAKLHIGERRAYVTTTTTTGQTVSTVAEEVSFVDVGIQLSVTPTINDDGYITMKVKPEVSSVSEILITPTNNKIPIIDTSLAETTVMVKDRTTILIGGLRKDEKAYDSRGTPGVSKVPVLGDVFKKGTKKSERSELLVIMTPYIISGLKLDFGDETNRKITDEPAKDYREYKGVSPSTIGTSIIEVKPKGYKDYLEFKTDR